MSSEILFASSNQNKFREARDILSRFNISLGFLKCDIQEIQSDDIKEIARYKVSIAFSGCSKPVIVEDDGLFIDSLNGFPGPYSSYVFRTLGNEGILDLLSRERSASFRSIIAYCEKKDDVHIFAATVAGKISKKIQGKKWGYDPIFIPAGQKKAYSQLENKNIFSHRYMALKKFANWYLRRMKSSGR